MRKHHNTRYLFECYCPTGNGIRRMPGGLRASRPTWDMDFHHRFPGNFLVIKNTSNKKIPVPPWEQGQKVHFCGTTLFAGSLRPLCPVPTHRLPVNAGNASEDTLAAPFPPALSGPFAAPLFAPLSAMRNSLWMRLQFYFRFSGFPYDGFVILYFCLFVKHKNSPPAEIRKDQGIAFSSGKNSRKADMQPSDTSWPVPSGRCPGIPASESGQMRRESLPAAR